MVEFVIARSAQRDEAISAPRGRLHLTRDCFAEPVIGPAFGRTRWLAMTRLPSKIRFAVVYAPPRYPPERIVCLTEETVETLYLLGEDRRIVGVSGYAVRPPRVRREKPRVSSFISPDLDRIPALEPDLALTFSDLQADIVRDLVKAGVAVHVFNHRDVEGIYGMIRTPAS